MTNPRATWPISAANLRRALKGLARQGRTSDFLDALTEAEIEALAFDWELWARPEQTAPDGDWTTWLMLGGRGAGKTRAGAEWVRALATGPYPVSPIALVGETMAEARAIMIDGVSGLLAVHPATERPRFSRNRLLWPNGAEAHLMSASDPDRLRGPQFAAAWCDELAKWPDPDAAWDMLQFGLRLGDRPRQLVTTTPRPVALLKRLMADPATQVTRMRTRDNRANLADSFFEAVVGRYRGTVLGRQELDGELIEDRPDALWTRALLAVARRTEARPLGRVLVAVDPPVTAGKSADACGIVVVGRAGDDAVVLADATIRPAPPLVWAERAVALYHQFDADAVLVEVNQGGDLVKTMIAQIDPEVAVREVRATRGKWLRAEPVAALYARQRIVHRPGLGALEDEMCAFGPDGLAHGHSPDRVDALVWGLSELMLATGTPRVRSL